MIPPPTVAELKAQAVSVRAYWRAMPPGARVRAGISEPGIKLLEMVERLPAHGFFSHVNLEGGLVVSRALVEQALKVLTVAGSPGCACDGWGCRRCLPDGGRARALILLTEALGL